MPKAITPNHEQKNIHLRQKANFKNAQFKHMTEHQKQETVNKKQSTCHKKKHSNIYRTKQYTHITKHHHNVSEPDKSKTPTANTRTRQAQN